MEFDWNVNRGLRVLVVNHTSKVSGAEHSLLDIVVLLSKETDLLLACPPGDLARRAVNLGIDWTPIPDVRITYRLRLVDTAAGAISLIRAGRSLSRAAAQHRADVVLANTVRAGLAACFWPRNGRPLVAYVRDFSPNTLAAATVRRVLGKRASVLLANSGYTASAWRKARRDVRVLHNGIDVKRFRPLDPEERLAVRGEFGVASGPLLTMVGQISPWKGQSDAVSAIERLVEAYPDVRLLIVGRVVFDESRFDNHTYEQRLLEMVQKCGLTSNVTFTGERSDVERLVGAADIAVMPSWQEPFGRVALEAMATGTVIVATDRGGPVEFITNGVDGVLLPPQSPTRWAETIGAILHDDTLRHAMGSAARTTAERHTVAEHVRILRDVLAQAVSSRGRTASAESADRGADEGAPLRVLLVNHTGRVSGAEHYLLDLVSSLDGRVHFRLACPAGELTDRARRLGLTCTATGEAEISLRLHLIRTARGLTQLARMGRQVVRIATEERVDLIHANSVRSGLAVRMVPAWRRAPLLVHVHDIVPSVGAGRLVQATLRRGPTLIANSRATAAAWPRLGRPMIIALPGVDLDRFSPNQGRYRHAIRTEFGLADSPVLALVGQITPWKGQEEAIRTVGLLRRQIPDIKLLVVGGVVFDAESGRDDNRAYERALHALVAAERLEKNVIFTGPRSDVERLLAASDLSLMPSWFEPFGLAALEAMATGLVVLATNRGGPRELIRSGINGLLLPPKRPGVWAQAIVRLLADAGARAAIGGAARSTAEAHSIQTHANGMLAVYRSAQARACPSCSSP